MSESPEKKPEVESTPGKGVRPAETEYHRVVHRHPGMSTGSVAALLGVAVAAAVVITMMIMNNQQRNTLQELADERAKVEASQQAAAQASPQPPVVVVPQVQPTIVPVPVPAEPSTAPATPSTSDIEWEVTSKLIDDPDLRSDAIDVKLSGATAILTGRVPSQALKARAERIAKSVTGISAVKNNIVVRPD
jgi:hypothetical protein